MSKTPARATAVAEGSARRNPLPESAPKRLMCLAILPSPERPGGPWRAPLLAIVSPPASPPAERRRAISISSTEYVSIIAAIILIVFAKVMSEARRLAEENRGFI